MSYCVNCGVKLNDNVSCCPLCQTPAWHPKQTEEVSSYFPVDPPEVVPVSRRAAAWLLSAMLLSAVFCTGMVNLIFPTPHPWSLYIIGAAVMLWIWFVLPMVARRIPTFFRLTLDVAAIGIYVYLISISLDGNDWFVGLALPILGVTCVIVFLLSFLLRGHRRSVLSAIAMTISAAALLCLGIEFFTDRFLRGVWQPGWSLVTLVICVGLIIPLRIIRRVPSLREEARRRFNM